jgi:hypothetical protein
MVIEDISHISAAIKVRKTIDFLDEKIDLKSDIMKALGDGIPASNCLILNLEENSLCCIGNSMVTPDFEITRHGVPGITDADAIEVLTYAEIKDRQPEVLFILGATEDTLKRLKGEPFLGSRLTFLYCRKAPFGDILSRNLMGRAKMMAT